MEKNDHTPHLSVVETPAKKPEVPVTRLFDFSGNTITVIINANGDPWWVAKEVCGILGYSRPNEAVTAHCKHMKLLKHGEMAYLEIPTRGMYILPESDLYRLIMRSKMPAAESFQDWVMEKVLPEIRQTGRYEYVDPSKILPAPGDQIGWLKLLHKTSQLALEANDKLEDEKHEHLKTKNQLTATKDVLVKANKKIVQDKPKVVAYDRLIDWGQAVSLREAAKRLGVRPNKFNAKLRELRYFFKSRYNNNTPYAKWLNQGIFAVVTSPEKPFAQTLITPVGLSYFANLINKRKLIIE